MKRELAFLNSQKNKIRSLAIFGNETSEILWQKSHFFQYILKFNFLNNNNKKNLEKRKEEHRNNIMDAFKSFPISFKGETIEINTQKITSFRCPYTKNDNPNKERRRKFPSSGNIVTKSNN